MDQLLCHCMVISEREVLAVIRAGARTVDDVGDRCEAGTGCGSCRGGIKILIEEEAQRRRSSNVPSEVLAQLGLFKDSGDSGAK